MQSDSRTQLLRGKKGIIFGALDEQSIAWQVAMRCHEHGARLVLSNASIALRMGKIEQLSQHCAGAPVIAADVTEQKDIEHLFAQTRAHFGGQVDFVLHSVGMSPNIRKNKHYTDLSYDFLHKTLDVSAMSLHRILSEAWRTDAIAQWGSVVALSYVAAQRVFPDYNDMADAKALLEAVARNFGYHYGKRNRVRVNTVSQSPTVTTAGSGVKGFQHFLDFAQKMSPLGNATAAQCADFCITLFSDYTRMVTMQNLFHDGGYAFTGVSEDFFT